MKIKRIKLFGLKPALENLTHGDNFKFNYAVARNLRRINKEIEDVGKTIEMSDEIKEYEKNRIGLCRKYALTEGAEPVITDGKFTIDPKNQTIFDDEIRELRVKYADTLTLQEKRLEGYNKALMEDVEIEFHQVKKDDVPKDIHTVELEKILDWIIE
jgi:hypothetical protein